jgi:hypothetical protein
MIGRWGCLFGVLPSSGCNVIRCDRAKDGRLGIEDTAILHWRASGALCDGNPTGF